MTAAATPLGDPREGGVQFGPFSGEMGKRENHQFPIRLVEFNSHKIYHPQQQTLVVVAGLRYTLSEPIEVPYVVCTVCAAEYQNV